jgi:hypothetical protein
VRSVDWFVIAPTAVVGVTREEWHGLADIGSKEISANGGAAGVFSRTWLVRAISGGSIAWHR